ncbi:MAG: ATP-dependent helicase [Actinomycetota bacterium]|nr:ATP-dependent helicase [Actinomycetota bacterium]
MSTTESFVVDVAGPARPAAARPDGLRGAPTRADRDGDPPWLAGLNDAQRRAVSHDDGPLLIVAGAGTGKTATLAARVARLVADGVPAERILLLTFTRRASREMLQRAASMAGAEASRVTGGTFHSVAVRLLHRFGASVGLRPGFTVLDQGDAADLIGVLRAEVTAGSVTARRFPRKETIAAIGSRVVNSQVRLGDVLKAEYPWCLDAAEGVRDVLAGYGARKREHNVVDYDDLLLYWRALVRSEATRDAVRALVDHVLVDEYQDTNAVQADILEGLCGPGAAAADLSVVGDDAQAIYSFRAASVANMLDFPRRFDDATVVTLEENYRSTPEVLDAANAVMADAVTGGEVDGYEKRLRPTRPSGPRPQLWTCADEAAQARAVCDLVLERREEGLDLRSQAVLFRTGHHSDGLELELSRRGVPYVKYGGLKYLEAAHVKDALAMLRILDNPADRLAWERVLDCFDGVGPATRAKVVDALGLDDPQTAAGALGRFLDGAAPFPARARDEVAELVAAFAECRAGSADAEPPPSVQLERLVPFCTQVFARKYRDPAVRVADIEHLATLAAEEPTRSRFLSSVVLDPPVSTGALAGPPHLDDDWLTLSTIHSAKGGEWRAVYVIGAADGNMPSDMAVGDREGMAEERRLLYVALTRARDHLVVTWPQRMYHHRGGLDDRYSYAPLCRFLTPITEHFDERSAGLGDTGGFDADEPVAHDPVAVELDALWEL